MNIKDITNTIINGDCLEILRQLPDNSIDLCLTDPPYGIKITRKCNNYGNVTELSRKATDDGWDDLVPTKEYFDEVFRVSRNQIVFGANYFWENFWSTQCYIIWDKREDLPGVPFCDTEFAWTSFSRMNKKYVVRNHGFIKDSKDIKTGHPTQKPTELFMQIINDFSKPGDLVLDCFLGSGTTAVACYRTRRDFIGIEISPEYCKIAEQRIQAEKDKLALFPEAE